MIWLLLFLVGCSVEPIGAAASPVCALDSCFGCVEADICHAERCPETGKWCGEVNPCPGGLHQTFCDGNPQFAKCVFISHSVCDESTSVWCCDDKALGSEWYCIEPSDCPKPTECMFSECWPVSGQPIGPNGEDKKCVYDRLPNGSPCSNGICNDGVCL